MRPPVPYPADWQRTAKTRDGVSFRIRPIRPDDEEMDRRFIRNLSPDSRYRRMMNALKELPADLSYRFVHVDYDRDMAFVALTGDVPDEEIIGVARYAHDISGKGCEFAVAVADSWQARGVGTTLMRLLFEYAHAHGIQRVHGEILADNRRMIDLAHWLGMDIQHCPENQCLIEASREI